MGKYQNTKDKLKDLYSACQNEKKYTVAQSLCYIEEEHYPWNTKDRSKQLLFYVAMLVEANRNGLKEITAGIDYIGEKGNELLNDQNIVTEVKNSLDAQDLKELETDIGKVINTFNLRYFRGLSNT